MARTRNRKPDPIRDMLEAAFSQQAAEAAEAWRNGERTDPTARAAATRERKQAEARTAEKQQRDAESEV